MRFIGYGLFVLSLGLMLAIIIPDIGHRLPILNRWDAIYTLEGKIHGYSGFVTVEIGGYKAKVDAPDSFKLNFPSRNVDSVFIVVSSKDTLLLKRIPLDKKIIQLDISL